MNSNKKRASGVRPKVRKRKQFFGNQHSGSTDKNLNESASSKKISSAYEKETSGNKFQGYAFVDKALLFSALEQCLCCFICHNEITIDSEIEYGLTVNINISCISCGLISTIRNSNKVGVKKNASDLNRRFFLAMRCIGRGLAESKTFCGIMALPPPVTQKCYDKIVSHMQAATMTVAEKSMQNAAIEEIKLTGSSDITVSGDGTWKTRGHSSRFGVTSIIGGETGKVIDRFVASSYCKGCEAGKYISRKENYSKWKGDHDKECSKNHSGSSALMEVNGMVDMFARSEEKHNARYTKYIGDGDCKTFLSLTKANPYSVPLSKIECVGHVQKRMGSRLRKLKHDFQGKKLSDGKSIGGKGRLTDVLIDRLTTYYGNAIRKHSDNYREMRKAIWAVWYHKRSNDNEVMHDFCPEGINSWCLYKKAVASNTSGTFKHTNSVPVAVMDAIKPVFKDLSNPDLLKRCLGGKTQNANESLNALIWTFCPKTTNSARKIVEIAVNSAVANFNDGKKAFISIMKEMGLAVGENSMAYAMEADKMRVMYAEKRMFCNTLEARIAKRREIKKLNELNKQTEGTIYAPGGF